MLLYSLEGLTSNFEEKDLEGMVGMHKVEGGISFPFFPIPGELLMSTSLLKFFKYVRRLGAIYVSLLPFANYCVSCKALHSCTVLFSTSFLLYICVSVYKSTTLTFLYWISFIVLFSHLSRSLSMFFSFRLILQNGCISEPVVSECHEPWHS